MDLAMETNCESRRVARPYSLRTKASRQTIALIGAMWLVSGCAHNVLYDENRDKEGQAVKKAVAEARLEDAVTSLEQTFAEQSKHTSTNAL